MEEKIISLQDKRLERSLVSISIMIDDALAMTQRAKALSIDSEVKLALAQLELENLFLQLVKSERS